METSRAGNWYPETSSGKQKGVKETLGFTPLTDLISEKENVKRIFSNIILKWFYLIYFFDRSSKSNTSCYAS